MLQMVETEEAEHRILRHLQANKRKGTEPRNRGFRSDSEDGVPYIRNIANYNLLQPTRERLRWMNVLEFYEPR